MRLADDRRGRVPFALVGVLLLLGSTAFATTLSTRGVVHENRATDRAMDHVRASATAALRDAVREAARDAAREPVTAPADTPFGRVLDDETPFRDALRIRIYVVAREHLRATRYRRGSVQANASLQPTPTPDALRAAKGRVTVDSARNGTAIRVRLRNVTHSATREGRTVVRENRTIELTVATPVLTLHDRATAFEHRLNRDPLDGAGLGRRLTARLYPITWARGYAQRYGAPVENVLANRHVATGTNGAVLETERAVFGRSDPGGTRGLRRARAHLLARDLAAPLGPPDERWTRRVLTAPNGPHEERGNLSRFDPADVPTPEGNATVRIGTAATLSLGHLLTATGNRSLDGATRAGYRARVRIRTATETVERGTRPDADPPDEGFGLDETSVDTDVTVTNATAPLPTTTPGERRFLSFERRVVVEHTVVRDWERDGGNDTATTEATWREIRRVGIVLTGEPDPRASVPNGSVRPVFRPGGPLDGPNMADVPGAARDRLVASQGGPDGVAAAVARGTLGRRTATVVGDRPDELDRYVYADLRELRDRIRNVTVAPERGRVATGRVNPPALLADRLRERRTKLVAAPETYHGAADRARVVARVMYLDHAISRLERRAAARRERVGRLDGLLRERTGRSLDRVSRTMQVRRNVSLPDRSRAATGPVGPVSMIPDSSPAYLTLTGVDHERAAAVPPGERYHPLAARNVNLFTVPYGDATDVVVGTADGDGHGTGLRAAGNVLVAAGRGSDADERDREVHRRLRRSTRRAVDGVRERAADVVRRRTSLDAEASRTVVEAAFGRWNDTGRRARAAANGSAAEAIATAAVAGRKPRDPVVRDRLAAALHAAIVSAVADARIDDDLVERAAAAVHDASGPETDADRDADTGGGSADDAFDTTRQDGGSGDGRRGRTGRPRPLAGLPVTPSPGHWYLTVNVWTVRVRGAFARFAVRTRRGAPGESLRYARDGSWASIDVDGDGAPERIGRDERLSFETNTSVVVAVPPYGPGVGDVGGDADERSAGWPRPACLPPDADACRAASNATGPSGDRTRRPRTAE